MYGFINGVDEIPPVQMLKTILLMAMMDTSTVAPDTIKIAVASVKNTITQPFPTRYSRHPFVQSLAANQTLLYKDVILAVALLEAGNNLSSDLAKRSHNYMGIRKKKSRAYQHFASMDAFIAYLTGQQLRFIDRHHVKNRAQYIESIGRFWAEDTGYAGKLKNILSAIRR